MIAETPESSVYTSIAERIAGRNLATDVRCAFLGKLMPFMDGKGLAAEPFITMHLTDYIELVDWTGRQIRPDKRGLISNTAPPILARLGIEQGSWQQNCQKLEDEFRQVIGPCRGCREVLPSDWPKMAARHSQLPTMLWLARQ